MLFRDFPTFVEASDDRDVKGRRCFNMHVVLEGLFHDERKMGGLGAIAIGVAAVIFDFFNRFVEGRLNKPDILTDSW